VYAAATGACPPVEASARRDVTDGLRRQDAREHGPNLPVGPRRRVPGERFRLGAFVPGCALGTLLASLPSCGPVDLSPASLESNCAACCDVNQHCPPGDLWQACGVLGGSCASYTLVCCRGLSI
jgi:hypothetical protein